MEMSTEVAERASIPQDRPSPPMAKRVPHGQTLHGETRTDEYSWLRDRADPDTIAYLEAENAYTAAMTTHTTPLQERLYAEMLGHLKQTDLDVPTPMDGFFYYARTEEEKQHRIYC